MADSLSLWLHPGTLPLFPKFLPIWSSKIACLLPRVLCSLSEILFTPGSPQINLFLQRSRKIQVKLFWAPTSCRKVRSIGLKWVRYTNYHDSEKEMGGGNLDGPIYTELISSSNTSLQRKRKAQMVSLVNCNWYWRTRCTANQNSNRLFYRISKLI